MGRFFSDEEIANSDPGDFWRGWDEREREAREERQYQESLYASPGALPPNPTPDELRRWRRRCK